MNISNSRFTGIIILIGLLCSSCTIYAQLSNPVKGAIAISGSFGEPRTTHFHAGIDFKSRLGYPFDTIYAAADGWVSRFYVVGDGYGNAMMINHGEFSTVYAHMAHFMPTLGQFIDSVRYAVRRHEHIFEPDTNMVIVKKGEPIGILGNTGRSSGPHLHFEVRRSADQVALNPFKFGIKPSDKEAPTIKGIVIYSFSSDGQEIQKLYYPVVQKGNGAYALTQSELSVPAIVVGIGVHCYDTMDGATNHNGIYKLQIMANGEEIFSYKMDEISFETSSYIHAHMDYEAKLNKRYIMKGFRNVANPINIYQHDEKNGKIELFEHAFTPVNIKVSDIEQNVSELTIKLRRNMNLNLEDMVKLNAVYPMDSVSLECGNFSLFFPSRSFYQPSHIYCESGRNDLNLAQNRLIPLFKNIRVDYRLEEIPENKQKMLVYRKRDHVLTRIHHEWISDTSIQFIVRDFDHYFIGIDSIAPQIELLQSPGKGKRLKYKIMDNYQSSGSNTILKYELLINGVWSLCNMDHKTNTLWHDINFKPKGTPYEAELRVEDASGNVSYKKSRFTY